VGRYENNECKMSVSFYFISTELFLINFQL
jgi:hypothetical protein